MGLGVLVDHKRTEMAVEPGRGCTDSCKRKLALDSTYRLMKGARGKKAFYPEPACGIVLSLEGGRRCAQTSSQIPGGLCQIH